MSPDPTMPPAPRTILAVLAPDPHGSVHVSAMYTDKTRAHEHARNIGGWVLTMGSALDPYPASVTG
jgi:hypothetical protein